jgi:hypothetical protein
LAVLSHRSHQPSTPRLRSEIENVDMVKAFTFPVQIVGVVSAVVAWVVVVPIVDILRRRLAEAL